MKRTIKRRTGGLKVDARGGVSVRVSARRMAQLEAADAKAAAARAANQSAFDVMDAVVQGRTDMEGTLAIVDALLDPDALSEAGGETMAAAHCGRLAKALRDARRCVGPVRCWAATGRRRPHS